MKLFRLSDAHSGRIWLFRIASLAAIFALFAAIAVFVRKGDALGAALLVATVPVLAIAFAWSWTGSLFSSLEWAKRYVQGAEGEHRHEWYSFKGQRVRVFLDESQRPWFALNEISFLLGIKDEKNTFRHYGSQEYGTPRSASERCLSESGLRRLIKHSAHPDAGALGTWLERDVLRMLRNRQEREAANGRKQEG